MYKKRMITFTDIIHALVGNAFGEKTHAFGDTNVLSHFNIQGKVLPLLECLLDSKNKYISNIISFLENNTINRNVNKRKMISMIRNSVINNELILFLSGYFDCNIWIYHMSNKIFKVYYMEEYYQPYKHNLFVVEKDEGCSVCEPKDMTRVIDEIHEKYIVIPIGIRENKTWKEGVIETNPLYDDIEIEQYMDECPDDPDQSPFFNVTRLFRKIKVY